LDYDTARVQMAESGGQLGNLINGIRVTDAAGNAYLTVPITMTQTARPVPPRMSIRMDCDLHPAELHSAPPDAVPCWAMFGKPVGVPFALKGVPVVGGKRSQAPPRTRIATLTRCGTGSPPSSSTRSHTSRTRRRGRGQRPLLVRQVRRPRPGGPVPGAGIPLGHVPDQRVRGGHPRTRCRGVPRP